MDVIPIEDTNKNQLRSSGTEPHPKIEIKLEADETIKMEPPELVHTKTQNVSGGVKVKIEGTDLSEICVKSEKVIKSENTDFDNELWDSKFLDHKPLVSECHVETEINDIKLENEELVIKQMDDDDIDQNMGVTGLGRKFMVTNGKTSKLMNSGKYQSEHGGKRTKCKQIDCLHLPYEGPLQMKRYECKKCQFQSNIHSTLQTHLLVHKDPSQVKLFICIECGHQSDIKSNFRRHLLRHQSQTLVKKFGCDKCSYKSHIRDNIRRHQHVHDKKPPQVQSTFKSDDCSYESHKRSNLRAHQEIREDLSQVKILKCKECKFETRHKKSLQKHLLIHKDPSKLKWFKCGDCTFQSKFKGNLQKHLLVRKHKLADDGMYKCEECNFETNLVIDFQEHLLLHEHLLINHECS